MAIIRYKRIENGASRCFDKQSKRLIPLNYRGRNQRHKRLFPAVCCLSESWAFQFLLAERRFQREREREMNRTEERERENGGSSKREKKMRGYKSVVGTSWRKQSVSFETLEFILGRNAAAHPRKTWRVFV